MPLLIKVFHQHISSAVVVVQNRTSAGEFIVAAVHEYHGDAAIQELLVKIQIGIWQAGFRSFDEQPIQLGQIKQRGQDTPFCRDLISRGKEERCAVAFGEYAFRFTQEARKDIVADICSEHSNASGSHRNCGRRAVENMRTAALALFNEAFLHQKRQRLSYGLTADLVLLCKGLLRREEVD